jgi:hypothetical protein
MYIYDNISLDSFIMRNVSDKTCRENQNTHFMISIFFSEKRAVYGICGKIRYSRTGHR